MSNPFVYGEVVGPPAFVDREEALSQLAGDLRAGQKIFLISPRRYGKSSLIRQALASVARRGLLTVDLTVSSYSSYLAFLEGYARAVAGAQSRWERARDWLRDVFGAHRLEIRYDPDRADGTGLSVAFPAVRGDREVAALAAEVFALPARLAATRGRRVAVALDEFQAIGAFDGGTVENLLRSVIQHQREVGYVFAGSEPGVMERMLRPKRPFYKAGPVMRLEKIPAAVFATFVESRFAQTGIRLEPGFGDALVEAAGNLPYDVQRLAHEAWDDARAGGRRRVGFDDLHHTFSRLLRQQDPVFEGTWQKLTLAQRGALRAVVVEQGREMLSADVRARYRLGVASTVQAALAALVREDLIAREGPGYVVIDSLFGEWVARRTH